MHLTRAFRNAGRFPAVLVSPVLLLACAHAQAQPVSPSDVIGEQKTAVILVNFQDAATQPISATAAHNLVFGTVSDFYWEASYQKTFLSGDTFGWFTIPVSRTICNVNLVAQEADKAAIAAGVNLAAYDRVVYLAPQNSCTVTGYNSGIALPSRTWLFTDSFNPRIVAHELGHNFGLSHSQALDCGAAVLGSDCAVKSYGDAADTMGSGATPHFNAFQKELLGWIGTAGTPAITTVTASGRYAIAPFAATGTASKALKIARGVDALTGEMNYYYLEYRQPVGFDGVLVGAGNLAKGVLVHTGGVNQFSQLLDMTPDSSATSDVMDAALDAGRTYVDSVAGISITLVAADANGATVDVTVGGSAPAPAPTCARAAPTVSLSGPTTAVAAGSTVNYTLSVTNRDSSACTATSFSLARSVPTGWSGTLAAASLSLSPGASSSTTLSVTSAGTATAGGYGIGAGIGSSVGSVHTANASATYSVASSGGGTSLTGTVGTDKPSYVRGETVYMSALVKNNGVPVSGASVKFMVTGPNGGSTLLSAVSGSDGYARTTYRLGKGKGAVGGYALRADATSGGGSTTANSTFSVN